MQTSALTSPIRALTARRVVLLAFLVGGLIGLALALVDNPLAPVARALVAWDAGILAYLVVAFWLLHAATPDDMARHAANARSGRHFVLSISIAAVIVSIAVMGFEIRALNAEPDNLQNVRVAFVLFTVALTWVFVHTSFATHYAFEYYGRRGDGEINGGLDFPGGQAPDFWDMWHFSVIIGLSAQTADVAIASRPLRHIASVHSICSFLFNTIILATTINFAAELFQPRGGP
jgi:uncharacterized membrane protein